MEDQFFTNTWKTKLYDTGMRGWYVLFYKVDPVVRRRYRAMCCCFPCVFGKLAGISGLCNLSGSIWTMIMMLFLIFVPPFILVIPFSFYASSESDASKIMVDLSGLAVVIYFLVVPPLFVFFLRYRVRKENKIMGNRLNDFFASCFCTLMSLRQMSEQYIHNGVDMKVWNPRHYPNKNELINGDNIERV